MQAAGACDFAGYQALLEVNPQELGELLNTVLINVIVFFRDREAWEVLREQVLPEIMAGAAEGGAIRVWSAGCASEPYSVAMLFAEALGAAETCRRVKIYGTDLDDGALNAARHANYAPRELETMNEELRSTNDELEATNEELRRQSMEASDYGAFAESVLRSLNTGVVVVDASLGVRSWNRWMENMVGLRGDEVMGQKLRDLDLGVPLRHLTSPGCRCCTSRTNRARWRRCWPRRFGCRWPEPPL